MKRNYPHLWAMLAKLDGIPEENKEKLVKQITNGRTDSLHDLDDNEYGKLVMLIADTIVKNKPVQTMEERRTRIRSMLKINSDIYNQQLFDWSYEYLLNKFNNKELVDIYSMTPGFWPWWINQYDLSDGRFLFFHTAFNWNEQLTIKELREKYRIMHIYIQAVPGNIIKRINLLKAKSNVQNPQCK